MIDALITTGIATGASLITSGATWLFARKKYVSEVNSNDIKNMQESLQFYINMVEDNKKRIDDYQDEIKELRVENSELRKQMVSIMNENTDLRLKINEITLKLK